MATPFSLRLLSTITFIVWCAPLRAQASPAAQKAELRPVLAGCATLAVAAQESVPAGTTLAVSADGRYLAQLIHTTRGAELKLRWRDSGEDRRALLEPPQLPPGVTWRVAAMSFSPDGHWLAVRSVGAIWVVSSETAQARYRIGFDAEKQSYPGKLSLAGDRMAVAFWPPESYLADAAAKKPIEVRFYDIPSGRVLGKLSLPLDSSDQWTELALSPDGSQLAVLLRPTRWPGTARLRLYASNGGKLLWEKKQGAEDLAWSTDGRSLLTLGGRLEWLDARTGKKLRAAEKHLRFSELQKLRLSEAGNVAAGHFARYNPLKRGLDMTDQRSARLLLWRLDTGRALCELSLDPATGVDAWPTARGELVALEENYEVRASLKLLRGARVVIYRVQKPEPAETEKRK